MFQHKSINSVDTTSKEYKPSKNCYELSNLFSILIQVSSIDFHFQDFRVVDFGAMAKMEESGENMRTGSTPSFAPFVTPYYAFNPACQSEDARRYQDSFALALMLSTVYTFIL